MQLETKFACKMQNLAIDNRITLGVSGGVDSVALLLLTCHWLHTTNTQPIILTVNHNLRPEAKLECEYVHDIAKSLSLQCYTLTWHNPISTQMEARIARYKLLTEWCKNNHVRQLLLAHHKNDQAETVLIRLFRGSGIDGLCGMQETSYNNGIKLIRPLLQLTKQQLIEYVSSQNVTWVEDPSNTKQKYTRTIFKNYIDSSSNPEQLISRLSLTSIHMQRAKQAINFYVKEAIKNCVVENKLGYVDINLQHLYILPEEIAMRVILTCIMVIGNKDYKPRYKNYDNIFTKIWNNEFNQTQTLHGCKVIKIIGGLISIRREVGAISSEEVAITPKKPVIWDNRFRCITNYFATICKNNNGSDINRALPLLKYNGEYINPFEGDNCDFQFIFSELTLDVLS